MRLYTALPRLGMGLVEEAQFQGLDFCDLYALNGDFDGCENCPELISFAVTRSLL